jgi:hypothetical protein
MVEYQCGVSDMIQSIDGDCLCQGKDDDGGPGEAAQDGPTLEDRPSRPDRASRGSTAAMKDQLAK